MTKRERQNAWVKLQRKRVPLERSVEAACCAALEVLGYWAVKVGTDGWPDRLILLGNGHHIWFEFKRRKFGSLTPAQRRRIPQMIEAGEKVFVIKSAHDGAVAAASWDAWFRAARRIA